MLTIGRSGAPDTADECARLIPGRKLPATLADFSCDQLSPHAAELILRLVRLVVANVGSFKRLAEKAHHSTANLARPMWAIGTPGDDARARICSQQLSKMLGKGARRAPDWTTVAWVLQLCVTDDERDATTETIAALWRKATGDNARSASDNADPAGDNDNDNDNADNATMAARLAERDRLIQALMDQVKAMGEANAEQRARLLRTELDRQQEREDGRRAQQALRAALEQHKTELATAAETHGRQLRHTVDNGHRRIQALTAQLETARHHAAVLAAHTYVNHDHGQYPEIDLETLLPIPGHDLRMHDELRTMLNLDTALLDRTITTWLRVYVRALLCQAHPEGLFTVLDAEQAGQLDAFTNGGTLPSSDTLRALVKIHPTLGAYVPALVNAATNPDKPDRAVLVPIPEDPMPVTRPRRSTRHNTSRPIQITVAELYARGDVHKEPPQRGEAPAERRRLER